MVVYVPYRAPVEAELEIETGEIIDVPRRTQIASSEALWTKRRSPRNSCYTLKRNCRTGVAHGL